MSARLHGSAKRQASAESDLVASRDSSDLRIQYTPTVVVAAISRNGRTPLTPSHGYFSLRRLALALVALGEARHEELLRQRRQQHPAGLADRHDLVVVLEVHHLGHRPRLRGVVGDLVVRPRPSASRTRPGPSACCRRSARCRRPGRGTPRSRSGSTATSSRCRRRRCR